MPSVEPLELEECLLGVAFTFFPPPIPIPNLPTPPVGPVPRPPRAMLLSPGADFPNLLSFPNARPAGVFPLHRGGGDPAT